MNKTLLETYAGRSYINTLPDTYMYHRQKDSDAWIRDIAGMHELMHE